MATTSSISGESLSNCQGLRPGGWSPEEETQEWSCGACTYVNKPLFLACDMCGQARPTQRPTLGNRGSNVSYNRSLREEEQNVMPGGPAISSRDADSRHSHGHISDRMSMGQRGGGGSHPRQHEYRHPTQSSLECLEDELFRAGLHDQVLPRNIPHHSSHRSRSSSNSRGLKISSHHSINLHAPIIMTEDPNDYPTQDGSKKEEGEGLPGSENEEDALLDASYERRYRPTSASDDPTLDESIEHHVQEPPRSRTSSGTAGGATHPTDFQAPVTDRRHHMRRRSSEDDDYHNYYGSMSNSRQYLSDSRRSMNNSRQSLSDSRRSMSNNRQSISDSRRSMNGSFNNRPTSSSNVPLGLRKQPPPISGIIDNNAAIPPNTQPSPLASAALDNHNPMNSRVNLNQNHSFRTPRHEQYDEQQQQQSRSELARHRRRSDGLCNEQQQQQQQQPASRSEIAWHHRRSDGLPVITKQEPAVASSFTSKDLNRPMPRRANSTGPNHTQNHLHQPRPKARPHMALSFRGQIPGQHQQQQSQERPAIRRTASAYVTPPPKSGGEFEEEVVPSLAPPPLPSGMQAKINMSSKRHLLLRGNNDANASGNDDISGELRMENPGDINAMAVFARDQQQQQLMSGPRNTAPVKSSKDRADMLSHLSKTNSLINNGTSSRGLSRSPVTSTMSGSEGEAFESDAAARGSKQHGKKMKGPVKALIATMRMSKKADHE